MSKIAARLNEILLKPQNAFFILTGALIFLISIAIYFLLGKQAKDTLVEQMLHREQLSARAGGKSIETFFEFFGKSMTSLAARVGVERDNKNTRNILEEYIREWKDSPVGGVILTDKNGIVIFNGNKNFVPEIGVSLSDREYFPWAKTAKAGEVFISDPLISKLGYSKGKNIVVVVTPVKANDGSFEGILASSVILSDLKDQYLSPLKISDETRIYLIDYNGVVISSSIEKFIGVNYLDYISKTNIPGNTKIVDILSEALKSNEEGKIKIALPDETKGGTLTKFLIAYAPINTSDKHWTLGIATPESDTLTFLTPFYFRDLAIVALAFLSFLIISIRIAKVVGYKEGVEVEHKEHGIVDIDNKL